MNQKDPLEKYRQVIEHHVNQLSPEEIEELNKKEIQRLKEEYREFSNAVRKGDCVICKERLDSFIISKPCPHWLLRPVGFEKSYFPLIYKYFDYMQIQSFLRWIANVELFAGNINDLEDEKNLEKLIEFSIKYRKLEWSFSYSKSDIQGHESASQADARIPHYHFQMRIDGKPFIDYSDFHVPFSEGDLGNLSVILGGVKGAAYIHGPGMGMQDAMEKAEAQGTLDSLVKTEDESKSVFHISTIIQAEEGKLISGDELAELIKRSKETGVPLAKLVGELKNIKSHLTIIEPGPVVPEQAGRKRASRKGKPKK